MLIGTPLHVIVDEVDKGYVTAYGPGLSLGLSGKESTFHVVGSSSKLPRDTDVERFSDFLPPERSA